MACLSEPLPFEKVYDLVKNNRQDAFDDVYRSLLMRPDYVSVLPPKESYSIFHYIVIHGALDLFNKVIALPNLHFNPLTKTATRPSKDIVEISTENRNKSPTYRKLSDTIGNLMKLDKFVDHGKKNHIDDCKSMLYQDPELTNQKPPYRKYYLIHHLAFAGNKAGFDQLREICDFDYKLLTSDQKTASEVALKEDKKEMAEYLEKLSPEMRAIRQQHEKERLAKTQEETKQNEKMEQSITRVGNTNLLGAFTCPLTKEVFRDPVVLSDGFTYERAAIQHWLDLGNRRSPMTNVELASTELVPNMVIKQALSEILKK